MLIKLFQVVLPIQVLHIIWEKSISHVHVQPSLHDRKRSKKHSASLSLSPHKNHSSGKITYAQRAACFHEC